MTVLSYSLATTSIVDNACGFRQQKNAFPPQHPVQEPIVRIFTKCLLASAAGIATVATAQAADLPTRKAAPVEYVRVCDAYGAGFFYIPGTDTCLKVGGLVLAQMRIQGGNPEYSLNGPTGSNLAAVGGAALPGLGLAGLPAGFLAAIPGFTAYQTTAGQRRDYLGFDAQARVELDSRTQSPWGTVRTFIRLIGQFGSGVNSTTGSFQTIAGSAGLFGTGVTSYSPTMAKELVYLDKAFIQFAGLTAGRTQSFFDFYADAINYEALRGSNQNVWALAYTATFGGGLSASLSIEDPISHRGAVGDVFSSTAGTILTLAGGGTTAVTEATRAPDVIGNIRIDQPWGAAQLSAALHPVRTALYGSAAAGSGTGFAAPTQYPFPLATSSTFGFAVQGGALFNLDMLAPGDKFWLQATYARGAVGYTNGSNMAFNGGPNSTANYGVGQNRVNDGYGWNNTSDFDCIYTFAGTCDKSTAFAIVAALKHYWLPTVSSGFFGNFYRTAYSQTAMTPISPYAVAGAGGQTSYKEVRLGTNLVWTPVKNFDLGIEGMWVHAITPRPFGMAPDGALRLIGLPAFKGTSDAFYGKLRAVRAF
jgi:hypothetical protein